MNVVVRLLVDAIIGYISQFRHVEMLQFSLPNLGRGCDGVISGLPMRGVRVDHLHSSPFCDGIVWERNGRKYIKYGHKWLSQGFISSPF